MHLTRRLFLSSENKILLQQRAGSPWSPIARWRVVSPSKKTFVLADDSKIPHDIEVDTELSRSLLGYHSKFFVSSGLARITRAVVLPVGYPSTVSPSYLGFVKYSVAQVSLIALTRILSTQAMLLAVGIGQAGALPIAAVINWVLKDGLGHLGSIVVGTRVNTKFDSDPKRYKFMSVYLGQCANFLGILSLAHPPIFLVLTTLGSTLSRIATLSFTSSRARIYENFSRAGNLGDLIRCSQAQSTLATMVGTTIAVLFAPIIGANIYSILAIFFPASIACHYFAYKSVSLIELTTLNRPRAEYVIKTFMETGKVLTCAQVALEERFVREWKFFHSKNLHVNPPIELDSCLSCNFVENLKTNKFAIHDNKLFISTEAQPSDALKGFFIAASNEPNKWEEFARGLESAGWKLDVVFIDAVDQRIAINSTSSAFDFRNPRCVVPALSAPVHAILDDMDEFDVAAVSYRSRVEEEEVNEIRTLHAEWFPVSYNEEFYKAMTNSDEVVTVVAEFEGMMLGIANIGIKRREQTYNPRMDLLMWLGLNSGTTSIAYILTLGVVDELRRKGLGKRILEKSIQEVLKSDPECRVIMLHVIEYNATAGRLYRSLGFREFKIEPNFYFFADKWYNGILFFKQIR